MRKTVFAVAGLAALAAGMIAVAQTPKVVTIGSKVDTEGALLCQMTKQLLESKGYKVTDKCSTGTTPVVRRALLQGEIDMYPEYTGSAAFFPEYKDVKFSTNDARALFVQVRTYEAKNNVVWLNPAPANNTWALAVPKKLADAENLKTMADFARYVNAGKTVKLAASQEFVDREDALKAFEKTYGFKLKTDQLLILPGGNTTQTQTAASQGTSGVNFAMAYGTDGAIGALGLVALTDPKGAVAVYQPAITVRKAVADKNRDLGSIINPVFAKLTEGVLSDLNGKIAVGGQSAAKVAGDYLRASGAIK